MSARSKRDARWNAVYGARFAQLYAERDSRPSIGIEDCIASAEACADVELIVRSRTVPNPMAEQRARRKKAAK